MVFRQHRLPYLSQSCAPENALRNAPLCRTDAIGNRELDQHFGAIITDRLSVSRHRFYRSRQGRPRRPDAQFNSSSIPHNITIDSEASRTVVDDQAAACRIRLDLTPARRNVQLNVPGLEYVPTASW
jgi:hypothetical protein